MEILPFQRISHDPVGDCERRRTIPGVVCSYTGRRREPGTMVKWYHVEVEIFTTSKRSEITSDPIQRVIPLDR